MFSVPSRVAELVETFGRNIEAYRSQQYNEAQLRREFIDPFFEELGWDITNKAGYSQAYKDVIHEDAIKVSGATKAPDYCFRIGGVRKFFLETKKPSIDIKADPHPAYQLRRYAWSAKLPLSILTDFEEFAVYDCQIRPKQTDKPDTARIKFLTYEDYREKWSDIADIFSKDAILKGSFDKFAISTKGKRGTTTVDVEFLKEIEEWRKMLSRIIALRNSSLSIHELNFAVQRTIDRILFLRMCEDRGIEDYGQLLKISTGDRTYPRLCEIFEKADQKYNSGLFHFQDEPDRPEPPDELTLKLLIDDKDLKWILHHLYYPQSPYEFSVLPAEILGNVYEQFLGKVITLTSAHRANIEEKPEVKKAGGVYYTPPYIVDYIVKNTVGRLVEDKTPKQITNIKILDPACGSGSFLLGAYTYLLNYHRDWYANNNPESWLKKKNPPIYQVVFSRRRHLSAQASAKADDDEKCLAPGFTAGSFSPGDATTYQLTISEKKRILLNNIFGVDIDSQAVEVTKLSLLLKVLEGEDAQTLENQYRLFHERALPDLANNIKCGNSLIAPDFFETIDSSCHSRESGNLNDLRNRINPFDWHAEFPQIFSRKNLGAKRRSAEASAKSDGFDAVIGNPPWGADIIQAERKYLSQVCPEVADFESSQYFLLTCANLLKSSGLLGMIIPNTFALNVFASKCRERVLSLGAISQMVDLSQVDVFTGPSVRAMILILSRIRLNKCYIFGSFNRAEPFHQLRISTQEQLRISNTWKFLFTQETPLSKLIDNIVSRSSVLNEYCQVKQGYIPYRTSTLTRRFGRAKAEQIVKNRIWHSTKPETPEYQRELQGEDVERYGVHWSGVWVRYGEWVSTYLPLSVFSGPRILIREITHPLPHSLLAAYVEETFVHNPSVLSVLPLPDSLAPKFLLGILNSLLMSHIFVHIAPKAKKGLFPKIIITDAKRLPCPRISLSNPHDKSMHDKIVKLVERMLDLHKKLSAAKIPDEKTKIQRQINSTDKQIDILVYSLYGLTEEEIKIVESQRE